MQSHFSCQDNVSLVAREFSFPFSIRENTYLFCRGWVICERKDLRGKTLRRCAGCQCSASWCLLRKSKVICTNWKNFKCIALRVLEKFYLHFYGVLLVVQQHNLLNNLLFIVTVSYRQKQTEVSRLEEQIRVKAEEQRRAGQSLDSTCQICLKTKFADGVGHTCNYCNVRCCARCGGKVALRSSKVSDTPTP